MLILGIETSCDETAVAVVENGGKIRSNLVASQVELHKQFYGVVPEVASRKHLEVILLLLDKALKKAGICLKDLNAVGVTIGPGLLGSLLVGVTVAKGIALSLNIPFVGINHLEAHLYAGLIQNPSFYPPFVGLIISGGHTELVYLSEKKECELLGSTRDDAVGEAFDKIARALDLGYPGGPIIEKIAKKGDPYKIKFPLPHFKEEGTLDFSFSGLKTAVIYKIKEMRDKKLRIPVEDIAAGFQLQVANIILDRIKKAVSLRKVKRVIIGGGVASNKFIKDFLFRNLEDVDLLIPPPELCTDNAAMVAALAYEKIKRGEISSLSVEAQANLGIGINK